VFIIICSFVFSFLVVTCETHVPQQCQPSNSSEILSEGDDWGDFVSSNQPSIITTATPIVSCNSESKSVIKKPSVVSNEIKDEVKQNVDSPFEKTHIPHAAVVNETKSTSSIQSPNVLAQIQLQSPPLAPVRKESDLTEAIFASLSSMQSSVVAATSSKPNEPSCDEFGDFQVFYYC
jgi:hypothetical protein